VARLRLRTNPERSALNGPSAAARHCSLGRKNHYGSKSRRGTEVAAIFYRLVETANLHGVDPSKYLLEAVRAADRGQVLFPWQMLSPERRHHCMHAAQDFLEGDRQ
jgi:transposase